LGNKIKAFSAPLFGLTGETTRFRHMGHQHVGNEAIRRLLGVPNCHNQHTTIDCSSCVMELPLWQATLRMNSCDFIPILLFRCTWPEMGKDVSHQLKEINTVSQ